MTIPRGITSLHPELDSWSILSAYRGSIAHGMWVNPKNPNSIDDKDVMGVIVPPIEYYFGLRTYGTRGTKEIKHDEWDIVVYEAGKFISLLAQGNPNVLMLLWLLPKNYLHVKPAGQMIIDNRQLFVGRHVYKAFTGYAYGQLHRMTHHAYEGHMGTKRKTLVDKYGYDCKNAAHLIRLLRMGAEFLKDGELEVERRDANQLLEIKMGEWTLEQVQKEADWGFKMAEMAYQNTTLPLGPDMDKVNKLAIDVIRLSLGV